jgi:hypothetical protein
MAVGLCCAQAFAQNSINTTSQGRAAGSVSTLPEQPFTTTTGYQIVAANDLGMHCGDLDHRIASILPPFNTLHVQVIQRGTTSANPVILNKSTASVVYSSSYQSKDPALSKAPVTATDGSIFKTNFWATALQTYGPFYPGGISTLQTYLPTVLTGDPNARDIGLPVPDVELNYLNANGQLLSPIGSGPVSLSQATMPDIKSMTLANGAPASVVIAPYGANTPQTCKAQYTNYPVFLRFAFGYVAPKVNWFAAEGIPLTPFDDYGRDNAFPLMRVQAKVGGSVVSSLDTVTPVSGESNCTDCHLSVAPGNGSATGTITPVLPSADPKWGHVPVAVSNEWAAYINVLQLHDQDYNTKLYQGYNATTGVSKNLVACQTCHYTPALDLLQLGPQGTATAPANGGLKQQSHETMSRVMHNFHGRQKDKNGNLLFPNMPAPNDPRRTAGQTAANPINAFTQNILDKTCYSCHPGKQTKCLRGAMVQAGVVCQDCHGNATDVGNDFSQCVANPNKFPGTSCPNGTGAGKFTIAADYYGNAATPRVPWLNEPGCGSCHTGDNNSNLAGSAGTIVASDGFRLLQAYRSTNAKKAPIVPANTRFAEPHATNVGGKSVPQLFRLSTGHGGVFCEGCHSSTHAEWPVVTNVNANDNVTATQLQGHAGKLMECATCHNGVLAASTGLKGPHGMHPVGDNGNSTAWVRGHGDIVEKTGRTECGACHGAKGEGSDLAVVQSTRTGLRCESGSGCSNKAITLTAGTTVSCNLCHGNPFSGSGTGIVKKPL